MLGRQDDRPVGGEGGRAADCLGCPAPDRRSVGERLAGQGIDEELVLDVLAAVLADVELEPPVALPGDDLVFRATEFDRANLRAARWDGVLARPLVHVPGATRDMPERLDPALARKE